MSDGVLLIHKPYGVTSFDVVARIRRLYGTRQVGHTGTLDPIATGLLPVLVGRAVKASEFLTEKDKEYVAGLRLGLTTDSEDVTGNILTQSEAIPPRQIVMDTAKGFVGEIMQVPPMYSALKVGGEKLVDLARRGIVIEREARPITVHELDIEGDGADYTMRVFCSKGTYIRTLCADIGAKLGCGGAMKTICRASASGFTLADAHTLTELENMTETERERCVFPVEYIFRGYDEVKLQPFFAKLAHSGLEIYLKKIGIDLPLGARVRLSDGKGFFALGEVREYEHGLAIKPIRQFE
jgi:tRNA pseudouridine55 synthase